MSVSNSMVRKLVIITTNMDNKRLALQSAPDGVDTICDLNYNNDNDALHNLDIYYPHGHTDKKLPVIIDIHGGSWLYGRKELNKYYAMHLAKQGFAVVNINFALLKEGVTYPKLIKDVFLACKWIKENAEQYFFDMNNIFITGDSSGGHIAAYAAAVSTDKKLAQMLEIEVPFQFNAVGCTCAVFDIDNFPKKFKISFIINLHELFLGEDYLNNPMHDSLIIKNNKIENFPPMFMNTGAQDFIRTQTLNFANSLKEKGVEYELVDYNKKDASDSLIHDYNVLYPERPESVETNTKMCDFFKRHIK